MYRPGVEKDDQDVESEKHESVEIVMEVELHPGLADGFHAAFEDGVFNGVGIVGDDLHEPQDNRHNYHDQRKKDGDDQKQAD